MDSTSRAAMNQRARELNTPGALQVAVLDAPDMAHVCVHYSFEALLAPGLTPTLVPPAQLASTLNEFDVVYVPGGTHRQALDSLGVFVKL